MEKSRVLSRKQQIAAIAASVGLSVLMTAGAVFGATTISTDITTGGTLTVTGAATLSSTLTVTGLTTVVYASSTSQSLARAGTLMLGGMATATSLTGNIATQGTLDALSLSTLAGVISSASSTMSARLNVGGALAATGTLQVTGAARLYSTAQVDGLTTLAYASTTGVSLNRASALMVGGMATVTGLTGNIATLGTLDAASLSTLAGVISSASSTMSARLNVGGALAATGTAQVTGATRLYSTLDVEGLTTLVYASTTGVSLNRASALTLGGMATVTSITGLIETQGNMTVAGNLTVSGTFSPALASSTQISVMSRLYVGGTATTTIDSAGNLDVLGSATLRYASTTGVSLNRSSALMAGGMATVTSITGDISTQGTLTVTSVSTLAGVVSSASSTMSARLNVGGALAATGTLQVTGASRLYDTLTVDGLTTLVYASTTGVSLNRNSALMIGGMATVSPITGNINTEGSVTVVGTASTTNLLVGGGSTITGMVVGFCNIPNSTIAASTTVGVLCSSATGILTNYRVFVSATGSLPTNFVVTQASSSAADVIGLLIANRGYPTAVTTTGNVSLNFFGVK